MKTACIVFGERAVMRYMWGSVLLAAAASLSPVATASQDEASFFCYWVAGQCVGMSAASLETICWPSAR